MNTYTQPSLGCTENECNPLFQICAGLDPTLAHAAPVNGELIAGVVCGVLAVLLGLTITRSYYKHQKQKNNAQLSMRGMEKLSKMQQQDQVCLDVVVVVTLYHSYYI